MDDAALLQTLRVRFNELMAVTMSRCIAEIHYHPAYVLRYMADHDGVDTAEWLVSKPDETTGFTRLWEEGRLDLSAEALILRPEFAPLFSTDLRRTASDTLTAYQWKELAKIKRP
ncbi:MAG TPA: hypothetical protein VHI51_01875 [Ktedonobacterales bacterium]|jgi:hypothetical protein|nr:hypothetical protein [Ktedonobacterales bacterium]